jgi:hypothetical protein
MPRLVHVADVIREGRPVPSDQARPAGSSSTRTLGFMETTPATATRRSCPPDSSKGDLERISSVSPTIFAPPLPAPSRLPREALVRGPKRDILPYRLLENLLFAYWNTNPTSAGGGAVPPLLPDVDAVHKHTAGRRLKEPVEVLNQSRLSGPCGPMSPTNTLRPRSGNSRREGVDSEVEPRLYMWVSSLTSIGISLPPVLEPIGRQRNGVSCCYHHRWTASPEGNVQPQRQEFVLVLENFLWGVPASGPCP